MQDDLLSKISNTLAELVKEGYVELFVREDGEFVYELTERGKELGEKLKKEKEE